MRTSGCKRDDLVQRCFHQRNVVALFGRHCIVVEQIGIVGEALNTCVQYRQRVVSLVCFTQQLRLRHDDLRLFPLAFRFEAGQQRTCSNHVAALGDDLRALYLRAKISFAGFDL